MKLLVLGGTVYVSKAAAELAAARGHDVTVAARGSSGVPPSGVRFVKVDRASPDGLSALRGQSFDAVIDVARIPAQVGAALDALADRCGHWIFVSSVSAYADLSTRHGTVASTPLLQPVAEDSMDPAAELYGRSKVACENLVRLRFGDAAFIVRPGLVVGPADPNDRFGYWPKRIAEGGEVLAPGSPEDGVQWIDVRDLATWLVEAAERRGAGVFDAACARSTREHFLIEIARALGTQAKFTWVSNDFLLEREVQPWSGPQALGLWLPLPEYRGMLERDTTASVAAGMPIRPLADTVRDWCAWHAALTGPHVLTADLARGKEAELLHAWHARQSTP